jgi:hypothetical protein
MRNRFRVDRAVGGWSVVVAALLAALVVAGAAAVAGSRDPSTSVQSQITKLKKRVAKATRTANTALEVAQDASKATGPQGIQGEPGQPGAPGADGAPGAPGLVPIARGFDSSQDLTSSTTPADLGGPSVQFTLGPDGGFVQMLAVAEVSTENGATTCLAPFELDGVNDIGISVANTGAAFQQGDATTDLQYLSPGTHTARLEYHRQTGTGTCSYRNRRLNVVLFE